MRRFIGILFAAFMLLSVSGLAAQQATPEATDTISPLQVVESTPETGQELGLSSPIVIYFDRAVDCSTVENAVTMSPRAEGTFACDGPNARLTFTPSANYTSGTSYTFTVPAGVRGADGSTLAEDYTLQLPTTGELAVSQVLPANESVDDEPNSVITVIFNRPVVPLTVAEDASTLPQPLAISPEVKGKGEWLNTSIYVFRPDPAFAGGVTYTVTVKAGLKAADGATLPSDYTWSFSTLPPSIVSTTPEDAATDLPLDQSVGFTFNQPMDRASVESTFSLRRTDERSQNVPGKFSWSDDSTAVTFKPDENLLLDTHYQISLDPNIARSLVGGAKLTGLTDITFTTVPAPAILSTDPFDGQTDVDPQTSFTIQFASPMDEGSLQDKVTIDPKPWRDADYYYSDYNDSLNVSFPVEPSTDYTITIAAGMKDVYGNVIDSPTTVRFTTGPYAPDVMLQTPGQIGFYNAHNDKTQLFLTHRNVDRLDLDLFSVPLDTFGHILTDGNQYDDINNYKPDGSDLLRTWSIDTSKTGLNQSRYELLDVGAQNDSSAACAGAPASQLKVGDSAVVLTSDPLRARDAAPDGNVVTRLYKDYALSITGGPVCANAMVWWQVQLRGGQTAWVAEGDSTERYIGLKSGAASTEVDVTADATATPESTALDDATPEATDEPAHPLAPGIYALDVTSPTFGFTLPQQHMMVVGTANLTMKVSIDSVLVWATDVSSGEPVANAPVTIYGDNFDSLGTGTTDSDGLVTIKVPRASDLYAPRVAVLQAEGQFGITSADWSDGIEPYSFNQNFDSSPQQYRIYLYSDRPIYRPDQPVYFRGVARERNDVTYTPPPFKTIDVTIQNENGDEVYNEELPLTQFGTFSGKFDIGADASLGYYRIIAKDPTDTSENQYYYTDSGTLGFDVAEYRAPEFQVNVTPDKDEVVQGDTIKALVDSKYFFGGNVSNAKVEYHVTNQPFYFSYTGQGSYSFQDFDYDSGLGDNFGSVGEEVASGTGTTDANGQYIISIPADLKDATQSQTWTIEATVTDESGQAVAGRSDVTVHKGLLYVGVAPDEYVGTAKQEMKVNLITVDWDSKAVASQPVDITVVERRWSNVQEQDDSGRTTWTWHVEDVPVTTSSVTTGADGKATFNFTPPNGGIFKITASSHDSKGNEVVASDTVWVSSDEYVSWRQENSNRIDLVADKDSYQVGDDATILIASPFQGKAEALVTVERGEVLKTERITLNTNSYVYHLPITEEDAPNVYVSVVIVKGVDANNPVAAFRMGLIQLAVDNKQKELNVEIAPDKPQAGPGDTVTYTVTTTDYKGDPVTAEVGVGLTDLATLSIADPNSSPILNFYYGAQGLSVRTSTPLTINTDQLTQTTLDTVKGGGGGFGEGGIFDIRQNFVDTAYWNATVTTGADGKATFSVKLPDNLTTWRLDARAVTSGEDGLTLVGQNTLDLISTKPLLIRPVTPRFFVVGDTVSVAAVVNNNTTSEQKVDVTLQAKGVTMQSDATQNVTIPAGGRLRVDWNVTVSDVDNVDFTFYANGNDGAYTDASKPPLGQGDDRLLPVYKYEVPETVGTAGLIRDGGNVTEAISLPRSYDVTQGELDIKLQPSLAASTIESLDYLQNYPYQCLEQTVSRFLPNIMTFRALSGLGLDNPTLRTNLDTSVNEAVQRLYAEQHVDGGWGWFVEDDSNPLTTAYALIGLAEARNQGFTVSDSAISAAQDYLKTQFIAPGPNQPAWRLNRQAFLLYALARSGAPDASRSANLYANRQRLDYYARAFLALTFHAIDPNDTSRTDVLLSDLVNAATVSATGTHWQEAEQDYWNWNTDTRTTAIALEAFVTLKPDSDLIPNIVRYLMVERKADAWETTQETAWAVMSLTDWMVASGELKPDYTYAASLNGVPLTADASAANPDNVTETKALTVQVSDLLKDQANNLVISRSQGSGILYYTAHLKVNLPVDQVQPLDRGIIVERRYTIGDSDKPVTEAKVGDLVQVRLTVIAPSDLHYVVIEDPIPAGTDAVNPNLNTSQQIGTRPELNMADPLSQGWGWWYFSNIEFRDQKVVLFSTYLPAGTYEYVYTLRAGLSGTFNVIPATGQEFYFPEVYGRSAGSTFSISDATQ